MTTFPRNYVRQKITEIVEQSYYGGCRRIEVYVTESLRNPNLFTIT